MLRSRQGRMPWCTAYNQTSVYMYTGIMYIETDKRTDGRTDRQTYRLTCTYIHICVYVCTCIDRCVYIYIYTDRFIYLYICPHHCVAYCTTPYHPTVYYRQLRWMSLGEAPCNGLAEVLAKPRGLVVVSGFGGLGCLGV